LIVYQKAYKLSMLIFDLTRTFPREEIYSLTDQIRRSSRSVTASIAESWAKRSYEKAFISKLTDSLSEEYETEGWIDYGHDCGYISDEIHNNLLEQYSEIRKMLIAMIHSPDKWCN
jgi:four helix bundle protein